MVTIKDVAREAGVNISTVSRTLGGTYYVEPKTRERVMRAVEKLGYKPNPIAKGLKEGRTRIIGYVVPRISDSVFSQIAQSISRACMEHGYTVLLCYTGEDTQVEQDYYDHMKGQLVDGFIIGTASEKNRALLEDLKAENIPVVLVIRALGDAFNVVLSDNINGTRQATDHLIANGCKRILLLNSNPELELCLERLDGYRQSLEAAGIPFDPALVCDQVAMRGDGTNPTVQGTVSATQAVRGVLEQGIIFDSVLGITDSMAAGALIALKERGLAVPEQVKIMGMDDLEVASYTDPPLTTMNHNTAAIGRRSVELLLRQMENRDFTVRPRELYPLTLVTRQTV